MSDEKKETPEEEAGEKKSGGIGKLVVWLLVAIVSIGGGFATPLVIGQLTQEKSDDQEEVPVEEPEIEEESDYIDFDEVVVNLREQQFSRYLKLNFTLEVPKSKKLEIEETIKVKKAVLLNHINLHFAEITTEDLKGKFGQNKIRRTMHGYFNEVLFEDGHEYILDILFRELHVQ